MSEGAVRTRYRAILADCDTRVVSGGERCFAAARAEALGYLRARIDRAGIATPARLARLRLAWMRISDPGFRGDG